MRITSKNGHSRRRLFGRRCRAPFTRLLGWLAGSVLLCSPLHAQTDNALFWSLHFDGQAVGYLLGTIHSEDPRVLDFSSGLLERLGQSRVFAMEMVPDLPTLKKLTEYMHYQDDTTLASRIGADRFERVRAILTAYQVPPDWVARMKVWAAVMTLSVPPPETGFFMDFSLSLRAAGAGLKVVGLETLEEQLSFLENMPDDQQLALLDQALKDYSEVARIHRELVDEYLSGNLQGISRQAGEHLEALPPAARAYFLEQGIEARNQRMLDSLLPYLEQGPVFVAVGALHLPGELGLIALLRARGFDVRPLAAPFSPAEPASAPTTAPARSR